MKNILSLVVLAIALSGCSLLPSGSDYVQPTAYDADIAESHAKATVACFEAVEAADKAAMGKLTSENAVLLGLAIKGLSTAANGGKSKCGTKASYYDAQIVLIGAGKDKYVATLGAAERIAGNVVTLGLGWKALNTIGDLASSAGTVMFGDDATVTDSFKDFKATNLGEGQASIVPGFEVVEQPAPILVPSGVQ